MSYFFFIAYTIFFIGLIRISPFFKKSNLPFSWLAGIFLFKILMGSLLLNYANSPGGDYTRFYESTHYLVNALSGQSKILWSYILLPEFAWDVSQMTPFLQKCQIYTAPAHNYFTLKLYLIQYVFTGGHRYAGVSIMAFLQIIALVYLFKAFYTNYSYLPRVLLLIFLLLPISFNFFTSIFHKEGFIFLGLSICVYYTAQVLLKNATRWLLIPAFLGLLLIFFIRPLSFYIYFPLWLVCLFLTLLRINTVFVYFGFLGILGVIGLFIDYLSIQIDLWAMFNSYKSYYILEDVDNLVSFPDWRNDFPLFLLCLPLGFLNGLLYPFFWDTFSTFTALVCIENIGVFLFVIFCIFYRKRHIKLDPILMFIFLASLLKITSIGLLLEFPSAIMRYRAEIIPFFTLFFLIGVLDYEKLILRFPILKK